MLVVLMCFVASASPVTDQEPNWQPIYGYKNSYNKVYIDTNSLERTQDRDGDYGIGILLIVPNQPEVAKRKGKPDVTIRSMVRRLMVECSAGVGTPLYDLYFEVEKPTNTTTSITGKSYDDVIEDNIFKLPRTNPIYQTLCPITV